MTLSCALKFKSWMIFDNLKQHHWCFIRQASRIMLDIIFQIYDIDHLLRQNMFSRSESYFIYHKKALVYLGDAHIGAIPVIMYNLHTSSLKYGILKTAWWAIISYSTHMTRLSIYCDEKLAYYAFSDLNSIKISIKWLYTREIVDLKLNTLCDLITTICL